MSQAGQCPDQLSDKEDNSTLIPDAQSMDGTSERNNADLNTTISFLPQSPSPISMMGRHRGTEVDDDSKQNAASSWFLSEPSLSGSESSSKIKAPHLAFPSQSPAAIPVPRYPRYYEPSPSVRGNSSEEEDGRPPLVTAVPNSPGGNTSLSSWESPAVGQRKVLLQFPAPIPRKRRTPLGDTTAPTPVPTMETIVLPSTSNVTSTTTRVPVSTSTRTESVVPINARQHQEQPQRRTQQQHEAEEAEAASTEIHGSTTHHFSDTNMNITSAEESTNRTETPEPMVGGDPVLVSSFDDSIVDYQSRVPRRHWNYPSLSERIRPATTASSSSSSFRHHVSNPSLMQPHGAVPQPGRPNMVHRGMSLDHYGPVRRTWNDAIRSQQLHPILISSYDAGGGTSMFDASYGSGGPGNAGTEAAHHSADDEKSMPRLPRVKSKGMASKSTSVVHRRQRSGDAAAASLLLEGADWKGMEQDQIPLPQAHKGGDDDEEEDEEEKKHKKNNNEETRFVRPSRRVDRSLKRDRSPSIRDQTMTPDASPPHKHGGKAVVDRSGRFTEPPNVGMSLWNDKQIGQTSMLHQGKESFERLGNVHVSPYSTTLPYKLEGSNLTGHPGGHISGMSGKYGSMARQRASVIVNGGTSLYSPVTNSPRYQRRSWAASNHSPPLLPEGQMHDSQLAWMAYMSQLDLTPNSAADRGFPVESYSSGTHNQRGAVHQQGQHRINIGHNNGYCEECSYSSQSTSMSQKRDLEELAVLEQAIESSNIQESYENALRWQQQLDNAGVGPTTAYVDMAQSFPEKVPRTALLPTTLLVEHDPLRHPTYICPRCGTRQREFFSVTDAPQLKEGPSSYLAVYFSIYVIASLFIFGLEEGWMPLDCIYFAVVTLTTAGLGDLHPTTDINKIICSIFIYFGVACIGLLLGSYIAGLLDERASRDRESKLIDSCPNCARIRTLKDSAAKRAKRRMREGGIPSPDAKLGPSRLHKYTSERSTASTGVDHDTAQIGKSQGHHFATERHILDGKNLKDFSRNHKSKSDSSEPPFPPPVVDESLWETSEYDDDDDVVQDDNGTSERSKLIIGSPGTREILGRQKRTRHYSFSGEDLEKSLLPLSNRKKKLDDLQQTPTISENAPLLMEKPSSDPTKSSMHKVASMKSLFYDESSEEDDDSTGSTSSTEDSFDALLDEDIIRIKTAKYIFITIRQALLNSMVIIAVGALGFYFIEGHWSFIDCWYFTTVFLTTVGYGDIAPVTKGGKLFATVYILVAGTILLNNMSTISLIPIELRKRRLQTAVLTQFGDQLDDAALRELATGPVIQRLRLAGNNPNGLDECTREMFAIAMLVRLGKVSEDEVRQTFAAFRRLDINNEGVLNSKSIIAAMIQKCRRQQKEQPTPSTALPSYPIHDYSNNDQTLENDNGESLEYNEEEDDDDDFYIADDLSDPNTDDPYHIGPVNVSNGIFVQPFVATEVSK